MCIYVSECGVCVMDYGAWGDQKSLLDSLELNHRQLEAPDMAAGTWTWVHCSSSWPPLSSSISWSVWFLMVKFVLTSRGLQCILDFLRMSFVCLWDVDNSKFTMCCGLDVKPRLSFLSIGGLSPFMPLSDFMGQECEDLHGSQGKQMPKTG